ncbi:MAG: UDPGP type 1 family protein [Lachnospiraceae bacterium]|nr:UDPGP type 1 family protein [Lachnospiraceae bacterium]MDE6254522.1 UDPGP type 1 family protein [Lachnospiraceae bacterium]
MDKKQAEEILKKHNQGHILKYYDELDDNQKKYLLSQIEKLDFSLIDIDKKSGHGSDGRIEPLEAMKLGEIEKRREQFEAIGIDAVKQCRVGAVLLAGGQGTRLGFDKPKGMFNIGVNIELTIFERLIQNLMDVVNKSGSYVPLFIMTSEKNNNDTVKFFEENNYFGYDKDFVTFFIQDMAPSVDYTGKIYMEDKDRISLSPNGNGGWFSSLMNNKQAVKKIEEFGVEWLNVFSVDNVLQRIADPVFVGAVIDSGCVSGAKVVKKASPDEKVGVMCKKDGHPYIIEYYEFTDELKEAVDADGEPAYNYGVILNYIFRINELKGIMDVDFPVHVVEKKIPYMNENGEYVQPDEPNGYKFEGLILDMIMLLKDCLVFEVEREKEFAPVKNKDGVDSIDTARELLRKNGVSI